MQTETLSKDAFKIFKPDSSIFILQMPGGKKKEDQVFKCLKTLHRSIEIDNKKKSNNFFTKWIEGWDIKRLENLKRKIRSW